MIIIETFNNIFIKNNNDRYYTSKIILIKLNNKKKLCVIYKHFSNQIIHIFMY